jgi:hypothetical protein
MRVAASNAWPAVSDTPRRKKASHFLPGAALTDLLQETVVLGAVRLEIEAEIQERLLQDMGEMR